MEEGSGWLCELTKLPGNSAASFWLNTTANGSYLKAWGFTFSTSHRFYLFIFKNLLFIYLFLAVLGLRFCVRAFSSCGKRGPLFIAVRGPLTAAASLVAEHRLQTRRLSSCGSRA